MTNVALYEIDFSFQATSGHVVERVSRCSTVILFWDNRSRTISHGSALFPRVADMDSFEPSCEKLRGLMLDGFISHLDCFFNPAWAFELSSFGRPQKWYIC